MHIRIGWLVAGVLGAGIVIALLAGSDPAGEPGAQGSSDRGPEPGEGAITQSAGPGLSTAEGITDVAAPDGRAANAGPPPVIARTAPSEEAAAGISGSNAVGSHTVEVGEYIDPEAFPSEQDTTPMQVGDYLDPDSDFTGD